MKRVASLFLTIALITTLSIPVSASAADLTIEEKTSYLIDLGLPEAFLSEMDDEIISSIYNESLGNYVELVSHKKENGLSLSNSSSIARSSITDGNFEMDTTVLAVYENDRVTFRYYAVYTQYEWVGMPSHRLRDGITVNWDADLLSYMSGSFYYDPSYKAIGSSSWTADSTNYTVRPDNSSQGGIGVTFNLRPSASALKGTAFIRLAKKNASASGNYTAINSNYAHTTEELSADSLTIGLTDVSTTFVCEYFYQNCASSANVTIP